MDDILTPALSARNQELLKLYLAGWSHERMGSRLDIKPQTVSNTITRLKFSQYRKQRERAKLARVAEDFLEQEELNFAGEHSVFGTPPKDFKLNFTLHSGQQEVFNLLQQNTVSDHPASVITICAGRGWGKTSFLGHVLVEYLQNHSNAQVLWVAPQSTTGMSLIEDFFKGVDEDTGLRLVPDRDPDRNRVWEFTGTKSGNVLRWWNGASVTFRSAANPDSIVSRSYSMVIVDEAALIADPSVFKQKILAVARKKDAKIFLVSTPRDKNWFHEYYQRGLDASEPNYISFHQTYKQNPKYSPTLLALIKDVPQRVYEQEFLGHFIEDGTSVFADIDRCIVGEELEFSGNQQEWQLQIDPSGGRFVVGVDLAKSIDFTVIIGMNIDTGEVVYYRRLNKVGYNEVLPLIAGVCKSLNDATLIFDNTGVGAGLADFIDQRDVITEPFTFTNESKNDLINRLIVAIEQGSIKFPHIPTLLKELRCFTYETTRTGKISYNAPSGSHDDTVIALALANLHRDKNASISVDCQVIDAVISFNFNQGRPKSFRQFMLDDDY